MREAEQEQLEALIRQLEQDIEVQERQNENIEQFIRKVHKYEDLTGLTPRSLRDLVSGIYVGAPDKSTGKRRQSIHIKYDGIGFIPLEELTEVKTTGLAGGLHRPYKGLLPAAPKRCTEYLPFARNAPPLLK